MWNKYNRIDSLEKIQQVDQTLMDGDKPRYPLLSVDTETNGLLIYRHTVVGFSFSFNATQGFYVPLLDWVPDKSSLKTRKVHKVSYDCYMGGHLKCVWTGKEYPEFVKPHEYEMPEFIPALVKRWFGNVSLIMHNAPFDVNKIYSCLGVDLKDNVLLDTALLSHILNENTSNGLKETAAEWKDDLGINPHVMANQEQKELGLSVIQNGGKVTPSGKPVTVWRSAPDLMSKYACADTFLTYGLYEVGMQRFQDEFGQDGLKWLFHDEVMPLCREVVIPMKRKGVYIDVPYFEKINVETANKMIELEDSIIKQIEPYLDDFTLGKSLDEAVSNTRFIKKVIELENLAMPKKYDKKTDTWKETLAKAAVKKAYQENPHWIFGYIIGEDEIKYSENKIKDIKNKLYFEAENKRYRFNIGSDAHLRWLFFDKMKIDSKDWDTTDSGLVSVKAEVLEEKLNNEIPWIKDLLLFKKLRKMHSTYILPALELHLDGWLYMDMKQNGTTSGRFACSGGYNLQTLPRIEELDRCPNCGAKEEDGDVNNDYYIELVANQKCHKCDFEQLDIICPSAIKKGFIAPPGYKIVNADYSSLEPRCFAYVSGDDKLKEVYWKELDLYSKVYCDMFDPGHEFSPDPKDANFLKTVNKPARTSVKPIVLGIPYGAQAAQVAYLLGKYKTINDRKTGLPKKILDYDYGQFIIDKYLGTYQDLYKYMEKQEIDAVTKGYITSLIGRRRHFKYTKVMYEFLLSKNVNFKGFVLTRNKQLRESANVSITTEYGDIFTADEDDLKSVGEKLGIPYSKLKEKGYWDYLKAVFKDELNNAKNWPIQSLAGHITNKGMLDTTRLYKNNNLDAWVFLQVHDEISCYVKINEEEQGAEYLRVGMENNEYAKKLDVAMIAQPIICDNIKDAK